MKKSTLVLAAIAAVVVGFVYWYEFKRTPAQKSHTNPAVFHFQPDQVESVTLTRPSQTIVVARRGNGWQIDRPVQTRADSAAISGLLNDVTLSHSSRSLTASSSQLKTFGLAPPALTLEFKLKNGQQRQLKIGEKDFSGNSVYAQTGASSQVLLIPSSVLTDGSKTVAQLRDNSVLGISFADVQSFDLKSSAGNFEADRTTANASNWVLEKPIRTTGDGTAIENLIDDVANAKLSKVVSENAANLAPYGLVHPAISFEVHLKSGSERALDLGRAQGDQFYARDTSRKNMVFLAPASLRQQLDVNLFDLRDKKLVDSLPEDFSRLDYRSDALHFSCGVNNTGNWVMFQPASDKNKEVANWKVFNPLSSSSAKNIIDSPPAAIANLMKDPAIVIQLTRTDGSKKTVRISRPVGNKIYASASDRTGLFQMAKSDLDPLFFKSASDILQ
jgi:hypothetical protein